jgi:hypothetical protein
MVITVWSSDPSGAGVVFPLVTILGRQLTTACPEGGLGLLFVSETVPHGERKRRLAFWARLD